MKEEFKSYKKFEIEKNFSNNIFLLVKQALPEFKLSKMTKAL